MMNQQLDKFFREKLEHYHKPSPVSAWERIEAGLEKKTVKKFEWWKIAASLMLLTAMGYGIWSLRTNSTTQPLSEKTIDADVPKTNDIETREKPELKSTEPTQENLAAATGDQIKEKSTSRKVKKQPKELAPAVTKRAPVEPETVKGQEVVTEERNELADLPISTVESVATQAKESSTITMTISVEETNQYLDKNALAQATSEEKKSSTFKKLLRKASDLKSNQDPFGDLREKKNEILALNFRNEKRGQNK